MQQSPVLRHTLLPQLILIISATALIGAPITRDDILLAHWKLDETSGEKA